jgi:hypothetical protein
LKIAKEEKTKSEFLIDSLFSFSLALLRLSLSLSSLDAPSGRALEQQKDALGYYIADRFVRRKQQQQQQAKRRLVPASNCSPTIEIDFLDLNPFLVLCFSN